MRWGKVVTINHGCTGWLFWLSAAWRSPRVPPAAGAYTRGGATTSMPRPGVGGNQLVAKSWSSFEILKYV